MVAALRVVSPLVVLNLLLLLLLLFLPIGIGSNFMFEKLIKDCSIGEAIGWGSQNILLRLVGDRKYCTDHVVRCGLFTDNPHENSIYMPIKEKFLPLVKQLLDEGASSPAGGIVCHRGTRDDLETTRSLQAADRCPKNISSLTISALKAVQTAGQKLSPNHDTRYMGLSPLDTYLVEVLTLSGVQNSSQLVFGIDESESVYTCHITLKAPFLHGDKVIDVVILKLEIHRRYSGSVNDHRPPLNRIDLYVYMYGFFHDQMAFSKEGVVNLDCHTGNQLVSLRASDIEFIWSDFGSSIAAAEANMSLTETSMYKNASFDFFRFLMGSAATLTDHDDRMKLEADVSEVRRLHETTSRVDPVTFFTIMTSSVQILLNNLDPVTWMGVAERTGGAAVGSLTHLNSRLSHLEEDNKLKGAMIGQQAQKMEQQAEKMEQQAQRMEQQAEKIEQQAEKMEQQTEKMEQLADEFAQSKILIKELLERPSLASSSWFLVPLTAALLLLAR